MKKIISIIISILLFISLLILSIIISLNIYFSNKNIKNIINNTDYEKLVDLDTKDKDNYLVEIINNIYKDLVKLDQDKEEISSILNSTYIKNNLLNIAKNEINYIFTGEYSKKNTNIELKNEYNKVVEEYLEENTYKFDILSNELHKSIKKHDKKINIIRYFNSDNFKLILLSSIIILTLLLFIISKQKTFTYLFSSIFCVSVIMVLVSIFAPIILNNIFSNYTLYLLLNNSIKQHLNKILIIEIILIVISIATIMINDIILESKKKKIKPRIKSKYSDEFF